MSQRGKQHSALEAENELLKAENNALREALEPFAELANAADLAWLAGEDGAIIGIGPRWVTIADLRRAKAAMEKSQSWDIRAVPKDDESPTPNVTRRPKRRKRNRGDDETVGQLKLF